MWDFFRFTILIWQISCNFPFWAMYVFCLPDIDECKINVCHHSASCTNTQGSYNCTCNPGYIGDGLNCEGRFGLFHAFQLVRASIQWTRSESLLIMWRLPTILSLCRVHFIQIQITWPPFMCISAILNTLAKRFRTSFATCWGRPICPTTCYTSLIFIYFRMRSSALN